MPADTSQLDLTGVASCASFNFRRTARAVTRLYDLAFNGSGIRSTQFTILIGVAKTQPTPIGALSDLLIIDRTTLTRSLRLLKNQGLLDVSPRSTKRQRFVTLTQKGVQLLARSIPAWRQAQDSFVATVGADYWRDLRSQLEKLAHVAISLENPAQPK